MNRLYALQVSELKKKFAALGVDISRLVGDLQEFELLEDESGLRRWSPPIAGDGQFYRDLAAGNQWYYLSDKKEYEIARQYIEGGPVLEVGCGEGSFALKGVLPCYVGLELNEEAIRKAKSKGLNVLRQDFQDYAAQNPSTVSCVCSFQVLEHLPSPESFFRSSFEVLKDDGLMITAVPAEDSFVGTMKDHCLNAPPHHITRWTDKCLKNLPCRSGFQCLDIIHIPVEKIHARLFWSTLLDRVVSQEGVGEGIRRKVKRKIFWAMLDVLGVPNTVPEDFFIPGHTVVAVHKKFSP